MKSGLRKLDNEVSIMASRLDTIFQHARTVPRDSDNIPIAKEPGISMDEQRRIRSHVKTSLSLADENMLRYIQENLTIMKDCLNFLLSLETGEPMQIFELAPDAQPEHHRHSQDSQVPQGTPPTWTPWSLQRGNASSRAGPYAYPPSDELVDDADADTQR